MTGSLLEKGATVAFGSDWPVAPLDPIGGLFIAVTRSTPEGEPAGGWIPEEKIALDEAVRAYTAAGAWASFDDQRKGTLERGMLADIVILSRDIFELPPEHLLDAEVVTTIMDGKVVYRRDVVDDTDR